jgi:hypothetical protein
MKEGGGCILRELGLTELNNASSCHHSSFYIPGTIARVTRCTMRRTRAILSLLFSNLIYTLVTTRGPALAVEFAE